MTHARFHRITIETVANGYIVSGYSKGCVTNQPDTLYVFSTLDALKAALLELVTPEAAARNAALDTASSVS